MDTCAKCGSIKDCNCIGYDKTIEQKVDEIHTMLLDMKRTFDKLQKRFPLLRIGL